MRRNARLRRIKIGGALLIVVLCVVAIVLAFVVSGAASPDTANGSSGPAGPASTTGPGSTGPTGTTTQVTGSRRAGTTPDNGIVQKGFVPSTLDVGVNRASGYQAPDTADAATLGARLDYEEAEAAFLKRATNAVGLAIGRAIERRASNGVVRWSEVRNFVRIESAHLEWLKGLMAPERLDAGRLSTLAAYTPDQRLALVRGWNAGARFRFENSILVLPRRKNTGPFGEFVYSSWTADKRTAEGTTVFLGGGGIPANGFTCIRCPSTGATTIPFGELGAKQIPDGVMDPGLGVRDGNVYRPPTNGEKPDHFADHSGAATLAGFPWKPYTSYRELIAQTASSGFKRTNFMNTGFVGVVVPSLFAVYLTPHYHGYHASTQSCHSGFGLFLSSRDAKTCFDDAYGDVVYGTCPDAAYVKCAKEKPYGATSTDRKAPCTTTQWMPGFGTDGTYVPGVLLMNDDVGSEWHVRPGDVLHREIVVACDKQTKIPSIKAPSVVSCCAAWNYAVFPHFGVVRSNPEPWSGDMPPTRDAVGNVACASRDAFVWYHRGLGIFVAFRSDVPK